MMTSLMRHTSFRLLAPHVLKRQLSTANAAQWKIPLRGGQNLSERHTRLESMLRGKISMTQHIETMPKSPTKVQEADTTQGTLKKRPVPTFHGFIIPEEPIPPGPDGINRTLSNISNTKRNILYRMLYVRMCRMCTGFVCRSTRKIQGLH
jgi:hypothetical protein